VNRFTDLRKGGTSPDASLTMERLNRTGTCDEQRLLTSALNDGPSPHLAGQLLSSLGITSGLPLGSRPADSMAAPVNAKLLAQSALSTSLPTASSVAQAGKPLFSLLTWIGIATLLVGIGAGALLRGTHGATHSKANREGVTVLVTPQSATLIERAAALANAHSTLATLEGTVGEASAQASLRNVPQAAATLPLPPPRAPAAKMNESPVQAGGANIEIQLIDAARQSLQVGDASGCLSKLSERKRRVGTGMLEPEATLLQVQALIKQGQGALANKVSRRYLRLHSTGPIAERIRAVLAQSGVELEPI